MKSYYGKDTLTFFVDLMNQGYFFIAIATMIQDWEFFSVKGL